MIGFFSEWLISKSPMISHVFDSGGGGDYDDDDDDYDDDDEDDDDDDDDEDYYASLDLDVL